MRATARCCLNVRSAVVVALLLVSAFVVLDSYTWRLLAVPWGLVSSSRLASTFMNLNNTSSRQQHARLVSPEEAIADIAKAQEDWKAGDESVSPPPPLLPSPAPPPPSDRDESASLSEEAKSLRKVEASLRHARAAIRRAVLSGAPDGADAAGIISPEVYRNATVFLQSYKEMEKRLKVFVYPEGEEPLVHNGPCKEIYAIEGRFIQELQGKNGYVTSDPHSAHLFFLPFSVAMMVTYLYTPGSRDMSPLARFAEGYVNQVMQQYPFWNRSRGADHFMLSCHDWGPHVSRAHPDLQTKSIRVLCNANMSEGYVPIKDASLPEIHLVGGQVPTEFGGPPAEERRYLAFFAGGDHGPVRPVLFQHWKEKDADVRVFEKLASRGEYEEFMKHSRYCLCPGGYEVNSPRIVEAIYSDCVPVIIADGFVLPFSDVLDWDSFSVRVAEADIPNLKSILQRIPQQSYLDMQRRIPFVRRHFLFHQPPRPYDVFNMVLHSVWLRRLNMLIRA